MKKNFERFMTGFSRAGTILIFFLMALISFILMCKVEHKALAIAMYTCGITHTYLLCKSIYQLGEDLFKKKEDSDV